MPTVELFSTYTVFPEGYTFHLDTLTCICPSPLGFESHERYLSVANRRLLVHSKEQCVPPAVETDRHIQPNMVEKWRKTPIHLTSPHLTSPVLYLILMILYDQYQCFQLLYIDSTINEEKQVNVRTLAGTVE